MFPGVILAFYDFFFFKYGIRRILREDIFKNMNGSRDARKIEMIEKSTLKFKSNVPSVYIANNLVTMCYHSSLCLSVQILFSCLLHI